jgi:hypothetical protein
LHSPFCHGILNGPNGEYMNTGSPSLCGEGLPGPVTLPDAGNEILGHWLKPASWLNVGFQVSGGEFILILAPAWRDGRTGRMALSLPPFVVVSSRS